MSKSEYVVSDGYSDSEFLSGEIEDSSCEHQTMTAMMISKLTAESKFVLYAIFHTPGELSELLLGGRPRVKDVRKYLKCLGWQEGCISSTLTELKKFTKELFN